MPYIKQKNRIKMFLRDAIIAFIFWTAFLTPYMIFIVKVDLAQYIAWIGMQGILVPPLGAFSAIVFRWMDEKLPVNDIKRKGGEL